MSDAKTKLKAALIGCGKMGTQPSERIKAVLPSGWLPLSHAESMKSLPGLDLVALCDGDSERVGAAARAYGVTDVFSDHREMIAAVKPDIVSIATRTEGRCEIIRHLAANGVRGIHAEKPLGRSRSEYRSGLSSIAEHDVAFSYGTTRRFMAVYRRALELVAEGAIGAVTQVTVEFGRTWLLWNHPHTVDLMLAFAGCSEIDHVQAQCEFAPEAWDGETLDADPILEFGSVRFANGVQGIITSAPGFNVRVAGESGSLAIRGNGGDLELSRPASAEDPYQSAVEPVAVEPELSGTQTAFSELVQAVQTQGETSITAAAVQLSGDVLFSLAWSGLHEGRRTTIEAVPEDFIVTGRVGDLFA